MEKRSRLTLIIIIIIIIIIINYELFHSLKCRSVDTKSLSMHFSQSCHTKAIALSILSSRPHTYTEDKRDAMCDVRGDRCLSGVKRGQCVAAAAITVSVALWRPYLPLLVRAQP